MPEEMKNMPNWCVYKTRWNEAKGKKDKSIFSPALGLDKDGKMQWASIDKPETWATFDKAMEFAIKNNCDGLSLQWTVVESVVLTWISASFSTES